MCRRFGGDDVDLVRTLQHGDGDGVANRGVVAQVLGEIRGERRILERLAQIFQFFAFCRHRVEVGDVGKELLGDGIDAQRSLVRANPVQRFDQLEYRGIGPGRGAMTGRSGCRQFQPERCLLGRRCAVIARLAVVAHRDEAEFVQHDTGIPDQVEVFFDHVSRTHRTAGLFVGCAEEDDVRFQWRALALQREHCHELDDAHAFHV